MALKPSRQADALDGLDDFFSVDDDFDVESTLDNDPVYQTIVSGSSTPDNTATTKDPKAKSAFRQIWDPIAQPFKSIAGLTGGIGLLGAKYGPLSPLLGGDKFNAHYEKAYKKNLEEQGEAADPSLLDKMEALPGAGDFLLADSDPGTLSIAGRLVGNIAGDPTTYIGGLPGVLSKAEKAAQAAKALRPAMGAGEILKHVGTRVPIGPAVGVAYAPEVAEGIASGVQEGNYGQSLLLAGMAALMGKGVYDEATAFKALRRGGIQVPEPPVAGALPAEAPPVVPSAPPSTGPALRKPGTKAKKGFKKAVAQEQPELAAPPTKEILPPTAEDLVEAQLNTKLDMPALPPIPDSIRQSVKAIEDADTGPIDPKVVEEAEVGRKAEARMDELDSIEQQRPLTQAETVEAEDLATDLQARDEAIKPEIVDTKQGGTFDTDFRQPSKRFVASARIVAEPTEGGGYWRVTDPDTGFEILVPNFHDDLKNAVRHPSTGLPMGASTPQDAISWAKDRAGLWADDKTKLPKDREIIETSGRMAPAELSPGTIDIESREVETGGGGGGGRKPATPEQGFKRGQKPTPPEYDEEVDARFDKARKGKAFLDANPELRERLQKRGVEAPDDMEEADLIKFGKTGLLPEQLGKIGGEEEIRRAALSRSNLAELPESPNRFGPRKAYEPEKLPQEESSFDPSEADVETQGRVAAEVRALKEGKEIDDLPLTPEQSKYAEDWFNERADRDIETAIRINKKLGAHLGIDSSDVNSAVVQRAMSAARRFKPDPNSPDPVSVQFGRMINLKGVVRNLVAEKVKTAEGKTTESLDAKVAGREGEGEAFQPKAAEGESSLAPITKKARATEEELRDRLTRGGINPNSEEGWMYLEKELGGEGGKKLTDEQLAIKLSIRRGGAKPVSKQAIGKRLKSIYGKLGEEKNPKIATEVEKPEIAEAPALPDRGSKAPKEYAAENSPAISQRLEYLASGKGTRAEIFKLGEELGEPLLDKAGKPRTDSGVKLVAKLFDHIKTKLGVEVEAPEWVMAQRRPGGKALEAPSEKAPAGEAKAEAAPVFVAKRKADEAIKVAEGAKDELREAIKEGRGDILQPTKGGGFKAESEGTRVTFRKAGNLWEIDSRAGDLDKQIDLLDRSLRDTVRLEESGKASGFRQLKVGPAFDSIIIKNLQQRGVLGNLFLEKGNNRFYDILGDIEPREFTVAARSGGKTKEYTVKIGRKGGVTISGGLFVTQEMVEKAGEWATAGVKLLAAGVKEAAAWTAQMAKRFGEAVRKHLPTIYSLAQELKKTFLPETNLKGGREAGVFIFGGPKKPKEPKPTKPAPTPTEVADKLAPEPKPIRGSMEVMDAVLNTTEESPMHGIPGGVFRKQAQRELGVKKVEDISINTLRHEFSSPEVQKDTVALFKALAGEERYIKRPFAQVIDEAAELVANEPPHKFIMRVMKRGGNLTDTETLYLGRIVNTALEEVSASKENFYKAMEMDVDAADAIDDLIFKLAKAEGYGRAYAAKKTQLAQGLAALRIKRTGIDPSLTRTSRIKSYLEEIGIEKKEIGRLLDIYKTGDMVKYTDELMKAKKPGKWEQGLFAYKAFLLTPASIFANVLSNIGMQSVRSVEKNWVGPAIDKIAVATGKAGEREVYHVPRQLWRGTMKAAHKEAWGRLKEELGQIRRMEPLQPADLGGITDLAVRGGAPIKGKLGEFIGTMFKLLEVGDAYGKTMSLHRELVSRAFAMAKQEKGVTDINKRTLEVMEEMRHTINMVRRGDSPPKEWEKYISHWKEIDNAMLTDSFQASLTGAFRQINRAVQVFKPGQLVLPFVKTPSNIVIETLKRTPLNLVKVLYDIATDNPKNAEKIMAEELAKPIVGTMLMGVVGAMALDGMFTGGGPTDPRRQALLKDTGWQPYSLKVGDTYIPFNRLEPLSSLMGMAADMAEGINAGDFRKADKAFERAFSSVAENLTNKTFLSGLEGLFTMWHDPKQYGGRFVKQLQGSAVPNTVGPVPFGVLARALDPVFRETDSFTADPFVAKLPGASTSLRAQVTPSGQERKRPGNVVERLLSPGPSTTKQNTPEAKLAEELVRISYPPAPPRDYLEISGKKIDLTEREVKLLREAHLKATRIASKVINDVGYKRLPDNEEDPRFVPGVKTKKSVLENIYRRYRAEANKRVRPAALTRLRREYGS